MYDVTLVWESNGNTQIGNANLVTSKPKNFKVTTSKVGTLPYLNILPGTTTTNYFSSVTWYHEWGFICANILNISTHLSSSKPRISRLLPHKWVLEHSFWYNKFISLLWHGFMLENSSVLRFATFQQNPHLQNQGFRRSLPQKWIVNILPVTTNSFHFCDIIVE